LEKNREVDLFEYLTWPLALWLKGFFAHNWTTGLLGTHHLIAKMSASKDIELTEKKTDDGRPQRSNSRSSEAMSKRSNKGGGFGTDR